MFEGGRQQGIALISVLLMTAFVTMIVSGMLAHQRLSVYNSIISSERQQLWQLALSGETWARQQLANSMRENNWKVVHLGQTWAQHSQAFEIEDGSIQIHIEDLGARFNLNTVRLSQEPIAQRRYQQLLRSLGVPSHDPRMVPAPSATSHLTDISELSLLANVNVSALVRLRPFVIAHEEESLNVNTANRQVLASLEGFDLGKAQALIASRPIGGYNTVQAFQEAAVRLGVQVSTYGLGVDSKNFRATIRVRKAQHTLQLTSDFKIVNGRQLRVQQRQLSSFVAPPNN
ncbi:MULTISPECIES: type II secretion system minor pseudopilin GspK [Pseudomonas]|jgi:general secretion pathway protein K|uniref:type II secretion system minor pseudopilin GspK n=1 Tax=Pseudomonas TaxID=286 RepID=UPI00099E0C4E|nr:MULTISPECIES: type II secretion system minor pseudopilin GspK [Pseudomonas]MCK3838880.1 general secretion pathway protein GspK [Pseudomonas sp. NCIMB 10586]OPB05915.1 hypothetical protein BFW89_09870 [Pseudomonas synxantha]VCU67849.1 general secretion pathway protein GspK [Pseudomonas synxantha]